MEGVYGSGTGLEAPQVVLVDGRIASPVLQWTSSTWLGWKEVVDYRTFLLRWCGVVGDHPRQRNVGRLHTTQHKCTC